MAKKPSTPKPKPPEKLSLEEIGLSTTVCSALQRIGIDSVAPLLLLLSDEYAPTELLYIARMQDDFRFKRGDHQIDRVRGIGPKGREEIYRNLKELGFEVVEFVRNGCLGCNTPMRADLKHPIEDYCWKCHRVILTSPGTQEFLKVAIDYCYENGLFTKEKN